MFKKNALAIASSQFRCRTFAPDSYIKALTGAAFIDQTIQETLSISGDHLFSSLKSNYSIFSPEMLTYYKLNNKVLCCCPELYLRLSQKYPFEKFNLDVYLSI